MICFVCGSARIYRQGRCQYDYRHWLEHGQDRERTPTEQIALNRRRLEDEQRRSLIRGIMSATPKIGARQGGRQEWTSEQSSR